MKMPKNYNSTQTSNFAPKEKINLGGHYAVIKQVKEQKTSTGKDMIVVIIDFADNDLQPALFSRTFANDVRPDKKWDNRAVKYSFVTEWDSDDCSKDFKGFCESVERSNNFTIDWDKDFCAQMKNKKIGVVYGMVEKEYNGKTYEREEIRWYCSFDNVSGAKIPALKELKNKNNGFSNPSIFGQGASLSNPSSINEDEVPF